MAVSCPIDLDTVRLRNEIQSIYARVASAPDGEFHFHRGAEYAERLLRYEPLALARIPPLAVESFAGVGNPIRMEAIAAGATVVDIGCGSAMDLLLAANAVRPRGRAHGIDMTGAMHLLLAANAGGPRGRAIGIDRTEAMLRKAEAAAAEAGLANVELRPGDALELPIESASADVVISNGVLNLAPDKRRAFSEVLRVLRPGGRFLYADIVVASELPESVRRDIDLWSGWIGGALPEAELVWLLEDIGFDGVQVRERFDPFQGTSQEKVARKYRVAGRSEEHTSE